MFRLLREDACFSTGIFGFVHINCLSCFQNSLDIHTYIQGYGFIYTKEIINFIYIILG